MTNSTLPTTRRLNGRLLGVLLALSVAAVLSLHAIHRWQIDRNADGLRVKAEAAEEQGELTEAINLYTQYLKYRPDNIEAQVRLGELLDQPSTAGKTLLRVFLLYENVLRKEPNREDVRRRLVQVSMRIGRFGDALGHLTPLLAESPNDPELRFHQGRCEEGRGHYADAAAAYSAAIAGDPQQIDYHAALIALVFHQADALVLAKLDPQSREEVSAPEVVEALSERMVDQGTPRERALLVRSRQRMREGKLDQAAEDIQEAHKLADGDPDIRFTAAEIELEQAQAAAFEGRSKERAEFLNAAEELARRGLEQEPPILKMELVIARIAMERGDTTACIRALKEGLSHFPSVYRNLSPERQHELSQVERQLLFMLADLQIRIPPASQEQESTVGSLLERMRQLGTPRKFLNFLLAEQAVARQEWSEGIAQLESLSSTLRDDPILSRRIGILLGQCYKAIEHPSARLAVLKRMSENHPLWAAGRLEYARALAESRQIEEAVREYGLLLGAEGVAGELLRLRMLQQLAEPADRRDWQLVEKALEDAARAGVDPVQLTALRAEVCLQQKQFEQSAALLNSALEKHSDDVSLRSASALLALRREDWDREHRIQSCREILRQAEADLGRQLEWEMIRTELALAEPEKVAGETLKAVKHQAREFPPDSRNRLLERVAQSYQELGHTDQSQRVWRELAKTHPQRLDYWLALARPLADEGRLEKLRPLLEEIRRIEGIDGPHSQFLLATALLARVAKDKDSKQDLEKATRLLADTARNRPHWAALARAQGRAAELAGDFDQSLKSFQNALRLGDRSSEVVLRVLQSLTERGRQEEAMQLASQLASQGHSVFAGEAGRFARALAVEQKDLDGAVHFAQEVWQGSQSFWDQLWLAEVRFQSGERGEALDALYRQTVQQAPAEPASWLACLRHLQRTGELAPARSLLTNAKAALPPKHVPLTLARGYELLGDQEEAAHWYDQAVELASGEMAPMKAAAMFHDRVGNTERAIQLLNQIASEAGETEYSEIAWARRNQALLLAAKGGYDRSVQAVELLAENPGGTDEEDLANLKAKATVLSGRPIRADRLKAIEIFQTIRKRRGQLTTEENWQLARLYEATNQWEKAKEAYQQLASSELVQPEHLGEFAVALIRRNDAPQAVTWLRMLEKKAPQAFVTVMTQARFHHSQGKSSLAWTTINDWLQSHRPAELDPLVRNLLQQPDFKQTVLKWHKSPPATMSEETRHSLKEAHELVQQDLVEEAKSLVRVHVTRHDLKWERHGQQIGSAAGLFEELTLFDRAEEFYVQLAEWTDEPHASFVLAKFLSRRGRLSEAIDVCERVRDQAEPDLLAAASVSVLRQSGLIGSGKISGESINRVEGWVEAAATSSPDSPVCLMALADLRLLQERLSDAEALYRKILSNNDRNVVGLNNVAWLSAFLHDDPSEALRWINRAIKIAGPRADLLDTRAVVYILAGQSNEAIRDLNAALKESPSAIGYFHLAEAKILAGDWESARQNLRLAEQMQFSPDRLHPLEKQRFEKLLKRMPEDFTSSVEIGTSPGSRP